MEFVAKIDSAMTAENIMLKAHALGLGACAVSSFEVEAVEELLDLTTHIVPTLLISVGCPKHIPKTPERVMCAPKPASYENYSAVIQDIRHKRPTNDIITPHHGPAHAGPTRNQSLRKETGT